MEKGLEGADETILNALRSWNHGNQSEAVDHIQARADDGDPAAASLIAWFLHQMDDRWKEAIPYVQTALEHGMPWTFGYIAHNMISDPEAAHDFPRLFGLATQAGWQTDPIGTAINALQSGQPVVATQIIQQAHGPYLPPPSWNNLVMRAQADYDAVNTKILARRDVALKAIAEDEGEAHAAATTLKTRTQHLLTLIDQISNAEVQSFFDNEATRNEAEATKLWNRGVSVLFGAAIFAILPIGIYYVGKIFGDNPFAKANLLAAHFAPAVALSGIAGVLLAQSRGRDRARQRARDLSVALGTMVVYSGQIVDKGERQRFLHDMGRTVIESFLRQESPSPDSEPTSLLGAIDPRP